MGWLNEEFERAHVRRFKRAMVDAREAIARLPLERREAFAREFQAAAVGANMALKLRQTWVPNVYDIQACVWCNMPAARCVIEEPCEGRQRWEQETACNCNLPHGVHHDFHASNCPARTS